MNKTAFDAVVRTAALAAAFAAAGCAAAKPASDPVAAKPVKAAASAPVASAAAVPPVSSIIMPTGSLTRVGGVVVSVDSLARSLTIKDYGGRTRAFRVAGGALLTKGGGGTAIEFDDIAAGDRIRLKVGGDVAASAHVMVQPAH